MTDTTLSPTQPLRAPAADEACSMYRHTGGQTPSVTHYWHLHPIHLQNQKYGQIQDGEGVYLCGTCRDNCNVHLDWLMGEGEEPNPPAPYRARRLAEQAFAWFTSEGTTSQASLPGHVPVEQDPNAGETPAISAHAPTEPVV